MVAFWLLCCVVFWVYASGARTQKTTICIGNAVETSNSTVYRLRFESNKVIKLYIQTKKAKGNEINARLTLLVSF
jgi:hypothetical protein